MNRVGFRDAKAAKALLRQYRLNQMDRDGLQTAKGCCLCRRAAQQSGRLALAEKRAPDCKTLTSHWTTSFPTRSLRFGRYLLLLSKTGGVFFREQSDGRVLRVRLAGSTRIAGSRFHTLGEHLRVRLRLLVGKIARALRRPHPSGDYGTTPVPEKPTLHSCPNPSTRPCVANRFRFSVRDDASATGNGGAA